MTSDRLWVVEMWGAYSQRWEPTVGTALTRDECRTGPLREWRNGNPVDRFRVARYVRKKEQGDG